MLDTPALEYLHIEQTSKLNTNFTLVAICTLPLLLPYGLFVH